MSDSIRNEADETTPASVEGPLSEEDAINAFLELDQGAPEGKEPPEDGDGRDSDDEEDDDASDTAKDDEAEDAESDDDPNEGSEDDDDTDDDDEDGEDGGEAIRAEDEDIVEIKVGDDTIQVPVKDLKRVYGQEAAVTKKSQAASQLIKQAETREEQASTILTKLHDAAKARYKQYQDLNLVELAASGKYEQQDILAAQEGMIQAHQELQYFETSIEDFQAEKARTAQEATAEKTTEALKVIQDSTSDFYIENFAETYPTLLQFAEKTGIPKDVLDNTPDPWLWKLINTNRLIEDAKEKLKTSKQKTAKKKGGKKVLKSRRSSRTNSPNKDKAPSDAIKRLRESGGSDDAAVAAFLALG